MSSPGFVSSRRGRGRAGRRGFTLIETALTTVIIGVGVLALVEAQQAFLRVTDWSSHAATATYLANEIRELTRSLPRHDPVTGLYIQDDNGNSVVRGWGPEPGEVTLADLDDIDDFDGLRLAADGTPGIEDGDLPGPVDGFGSVIPEILADGTVLVDGDGNPMALRGWAQEIRVEKIHPFDTSRVMAPGDVLPPDGTGFKGIGVDRFPLRVTVNVLYRGTFDAQEQVIATVVWIVP